VEWRKNKTTKTHPPSPSLAKRRSDKTFLLVPLFLREGFRACPEFISGVG